ncbi:MAG: MBL fold metallo-hydrolase [Pseudomonadota bacterium]
MYVPGCATLPEWLVDRLGRADMVLFDRTVWENDEMARTGTGEKTGARMGHIAMNGFDGSIARLERLEGRKVISRSTTRTRVLQPDSPERAPVEAAGWTIGQDGLELQP